MSRKELGKKLREILGTDNVYFQPPNNTKINYPCIIYNKERQKISNSDDIHYLAFDKYEVLVIDRNPDSEIVNNICSSFDYSRVERHFVKDNLNQTTLTIYY